MKMEFNVLKQWLAVRERFGGSRQTPEEATRVKFVMSTVDVKLQRISLHQQKYNPDNIRHGGS